MAQVSSHNLSKSQTAGERTPQAHPNSVVYSTPTRAEGKRSQLTFPGRAGRCCCLPLPLLAAQRPARAWRLFRGRWSPLRWLATTPASVQKGWLSCSLPRRFCNPSWCCRGHDRVKVGRGGAGSSRCKRQRASQLTGNACLERRRGKERERASE